MSSKKRIVDDDDEAEFDDEEVKQPEKKVKKAAAASTTTTSSNEVFFSLGQKKKISLSKFKGKVYINIREYYTDDSGAEKPGKKGIALTDEQWEELKNQISNVDAALETMK